MGPNLFVTKRMLKTSLSLLFSAILGLVAGLLAGIGKAMSMSETYIDFVRRKLERNENFRIIKCRRKRLKLDEDEKNDKDEKKNYEVSTTQVSDIKLIKF